MSTIKDIVCKASSIVEGTVLMIANTSNYEEFK